MPVISTGSSLPDIDFGERTSVAAPASQVHPQPVVLIRASTAAEQILLATAVVAAVAAAASAVFAAFQSRMMKRNERYRTQPIVIAYATGSPEFGIDVSVFGVFLVNRGVGPAINIHFGITLGGKDFPYQPLPAGAGLDGDLPRALEQGGRFPPGGDAYQLRVLADHSETKNAVYWCRYQNAFGETWETENPVEPNEPFSLRQVKGGDNRPIRNTSSTVDPE
jgi:hypothetical protein